MISLFSSLVLCHSFWHASFGDMGMRCRVVTWQSTVARGARPYRGGGVGAMRRSRGDRPTERVLKLARGVDSHQAMAHGEDFNHCPFDAVVNPVVVMVAENLANLRAIDFGKRLAAKLRVGRESLDGCKDFIFKPSSVFGIEVVFKVLAIGCDTFLSAFRDDESHTAARIRLVFDFALRSSRARRSRISFSKSSSETTSPRSASPSATSISSYASILSSLSRSSSKAARSMNTYDARPFCVRRRGRPLLRARAAQSERLLRNSDIGTMSSLGLRFSIGGSCVAFAEDIVRNYVESGKGDFMVMRSRGIRQTDVGCAPEPFGAFGLLCKMILKENENA